MRKRLAEYATLVGRARTISVVPAPTHIAEVAAMLVFAHSYSIDPAEAV